MLLQFDTTETIRHHPEFSYQRHSVNLPCQMLILGQRLKATQSAPTVLRSISYSDAVIDRPDDVVVPEFFFLEIDGIRDQIGCTKVDEGWYGVRLQFNMLLNDQFFNHVQELAIMMQD
jgi:hypothetical protein